MIAASSTDSKSWPVVETLTTYEDAEGVCLGWDIEYLNYPGQTFSTHAGLATKDDSNTQTVTYDSAAYFHYIMASQDSV